MKAVILAAGLGTRLRPLTQAWPKTAIPFLGQPLLRYTLAVLKQAGVTAVGLNTHHLPQVMEATARAEAQRAGLDVALVHEANIQGTGGGIRGLREFVGEDETFVVFNGDILFALDLRALLVRHQSSGAAASMVLLPMPETEKYGAVEVDRRGFVQRIAGHGPGGEGLAPWHFSGVHLMSRRVWNAMSPSGPEDINREVYPRLMAQGERICALQGTGYWSDLGTPSRYLATQQDALFGRIPWSAFPGAAPLADAESLPGLPSARALSAKVDRGASVGSGVYVGARARVETGARLERVAVLDDTHIAADEVLVEMIAWGEHRIPAPLAL